MRKYLLGLAALSLIGLNGCQQQGSVEKAGARVDEVIDNVKEGESPLKKKGTMEKVGEKIDNQLTPGK